ncbi:Sucrase ferredoxin domain-containing protein [Aspergillus sp. HF37]|nr:Sucrase ferredoxin domain-containing protein [Aspergillus sp. HF37]
MQSLLRRGTSFLTPSPTPSSQADERDGGNTSSFDGFKSVSSHDDLFTKVDPAVDGEECLHDCASCTVRYPARFEVDQEDKMYGNVNGWATHLLVATGKTDWVRDVADEEGSVMEAIGKGGVEPANGELKLSASNMPLPDEYYDHEPGKQPTNVLLLPSFTIVEQVTPALVPDLIKRFVNPAMTTTTPLGSDPNPPTATVPEQQQQDDQQDQPTDITAPLPLRARSCNHAAVVLLCSQRTRDARCGQSAPLLRREFERHLRPLGLYRDLEDERPGGVGIYFISHVGGHKYAANVIVYRRRELDSFGSTAAAAACGNGKEEEKEEESEGAAQGIWLARVRPEDCENIIRYTVLQGKVVKPERQLRGGFDRQRGMISW